MRKKRKGLFIPDEVLAITDLKPIDKMILTQVMYYGEGGCYATDESLAKKLANGIDRTVQRSIQRLIEKGYLEDKDNRRTKRLLYVTSDKMSVVGAVQHEVTTDKTSEAEDDTTTDKMSRTTDTLAKTTDSLSATIRKKDKESKKNKDYCHNSDELRLAKLLQDLILDRKPDYKKPNLQTWAEHIDRMVRLDKRTPKKIEAVICWCQSDSFWQNNILSTQKLREKFDQLEMKMNGQESNGTHGRTHETGYGKCTPKNNPHRRKSFAGQQSEYGEII